MNDPLAPAKIEEQISESSSDMQNKADQLVTAKDNTNAEIVSPVVQPKNQKSEKIKIDINAEMPKPVGPSFFGYKVNKLLTDFTYVKKFVGKRSDSGSESWQLHLVDRLLKKY